jgi:hypothetical protein
MTTGILRKKPLTGKKILQSLGLVAHEDAVT